MISVHLNVSEAQSGEDPSQAPDHHGSSRGEHHVSRGSHRHPASQGGVLEVLHAHLPLRGEEAAHHHGGDHAAAEGVVGVDEGSLLGVSTGRGPRVEAGPVHPEEDRPDLKQSALVLIFLQFSQKNYFFKTF